MNLLSILTRHQVNTLRQARLQWPKKGLVTCPERDQMINVRLLPLFLSGKILPFQLIYKGKTKRSIPSSKFPEGFLLSANPRHWSNEAETIKLLEGIIKPYIEKTKELLHLNESQKSCIVWDAFKGQETPAVKSKLKELNIEEVGVPKNLTHLLQPLDLTTNSTVKNIEKREFTAYFTNTIVSALQKDPNIDVTTIEIDLKLSTLKPIHAATMGKVYKFLKSEKGRGLSYLDGKLLVLRKHSKKHANLILRLVWTHTYEKGRLVETDNFG